MDPVLPLLRDLIAIPSVNPSLVPGAAGEGEIAAYVAARLRTAGMDVEVSDVLPGRPNVTGLADGREPGPAVMFCGHLDTVGVEGMPAPFDPQQRDGRMYGRGSQDMKGGVAAMIHAAESVLRRGGLRKGRLIVAAVADEEYASAGADALVTRCTADYAVIPEPTDLEVGVAHKGFSAAEILMHGRAAHGSRPADGRDAILRMGRVLAALERHDRWLQAQPPDPWLGTGSLHASTIEGGGELSSYPAACRLQFERRTLPGEPLTAAEDDLRRILADLGVRGSRDHRRYPPAPRPSGVRDRFVGPVARIRAPRVCRSGLCDEGCGSQLLDGRRNPGGARGARRSSSAREAQASTVRRNTSAWITSQVAATCSWTSSRRGADLDRPAGDLSSSPLSTTASFGILAAESRRWSARPVKGAYTAPEPACARSCYESDSDWTEPCCSWWRAASPLKRGRGR